MNQQNTTSKDAIINMIDLYLSKWKAIVLCLVIMLGIAYLTIRYSQLQYEANATLKIKEQNDNTNKLAELSALQDYGLFSNSPTKVAEEIEIIKSRTIIAQVVKELKLNIQYFVSGRIKNGEVYPTPPINIFFFQSDSIIENTDASLFIKIISENKFELSDNNQKKLLNISKGKVNTYSFGQRISGSFGDFTLTPNPNTYGTNIGTSIEIKITPINKTIENYLDKVKISITEKSNVVKLKLTENIKEKAELVLNKIIEKYNKDVINDKEQIIKVTSDFINNRLEVVSSELELVDFTAETLQKDNKLTALASQSNIYLQNEKENETRIINTSNQLQLIDYMRNHLSQNNNNSDLLPADIGITDNSIDQITKSHNDLVLQRNRILKNSSEKNPTVINLNNQISALKESLDLSLSNIRSANAITLDNLNREDQRIRGQIYSAPAKERQFRDIKRQQDIKESLYLYLLQKREETAITLGMSSPNAKIIDAAYTLNTPVAPRKQIIYLSAIILGLLIPTMFIYAKDLLDNKIHNKSDLQKVTSIQYLGDIPKSNSKQPIINKIDYSAKAEAFRILRTNIDFLLKNKNEKGKIIFVTSTTSQEGKSHTSVNLANSISFSNKKVLLLETDIRIPKMNEYLNISPKIGLTNFISDDNLTINNITVQIKDNPYLSVIPAGTIPPNPAELLMNERVTQLFNDIKKEYDYIIVDTAAVGLVTDTFLISEFADLFLYVVSANNIDKRRLHLAQTLYEEKRLPNMAVVLNGTIHKAGYGYGYNKYKKSKKS